MPSPYLDREADRLAYLLHRLKYPDAPPLLLTDWPEDLQLISFATDLRRLLPKSTVAAIIADLERRLAYYRQHGSMPRHCAHCMSTLSDGRAHFCSPACQAAFYGNLIETAQPRA